MKRDEAPVYASVSAVEFPVIARLFAETGKRRVTEVHLHHTFIPSHADFKAAVARHGGDAEAGGLDLCRSMWRFHVCERDFADIAQHVSIDPAGRIWLNRNWNRSPASATGFNGDHARGPFMIETIGNFDVGHDVLGGGQLHAVLTVIASVQMACGLPAEALRFHNEMTDAKSCPGTSIDKLELQGRVDELRRALPARASDATSDREAELAQRFQTFMAADYGALKDGPLPA